MSAGSKQIVIVGGSATGMAAALAFARQGHRVTIVEREAMPPCDTAVEAFETWDRSGAPQARHSHAFLARLHNGIQQREPEMYASLLAAGAEPLRFHDMVRAQFDDPEFVPEDDEIALLACRRLTYDWVLRRHLATTTDVDYRDGVTVRGLRAERDPSGLPRVTGVRIQARDGAAETLDADLVVDASGRRTRIADWLEGIGAGPLEQESSPCGIFYCSRFYRVRDGAEPPPIEGPIGADLGYMKYAIFQGDSRIFSVTLAASPNDETLRGVVKPALFDAATAALPATSAWVAPDVSEPITPVYGFGKLENTRRFFFPDGQPLALGLVPIGDALLHSNPIVGRGCTMGWVAATLLADTFAEHGADLLEFGRSFGAATEDELVPWYKELRDRDKESIEVEQAQARGEDPMAMQRPDGSVDPKAYMRSVLRDGLLPALREDLVVLRAFMRVFNLLDGSKELMANPALLQRVLAVWQKRDQREPVRFGPERGEMLERLRAAAA